MKDIRNSGGNAFCMGLVKMVMLVFLATAISSLNYPARAERKDDACSETSKFAKTACYKAAEEVYNLALGKCENLPERKQDACEAVAKQERADSQAECVDQYQARQEVCAELGGGPYNPNIGPRKFAEDPADATQNEYFPLTKKTYTYQSYPPGGGDAIEKDAVAVTDKIREISGVNCIVVRDIVTDLTEEPQVTEDTTDWYALDKKGNVWYFGEIAQQFEDGVLVGIDGSWTTGNEGAKPGYIMLAKPKIGDVYRQEFALSEAEDMGRVVGEKETIDQLPVEDWVKTQLMAVTGIVGNAEVLLHTQDFSALEPASVLEDEYENKYYAPGYGLVLTIGRGGTPIEVLETVE